MVGSCQDPASDARADRPVFAIAGVAGSGKTTLGRTLAHTLDVPLLDLDSLTNPLLDRLGDVFGTDHWNGPGPHRDAIRAGRYAVMRSVAADMVAVGQRPVLVAPFTRELTGGIEWRELVDSVAPVALQVLHVDGPPELFAHRRGRRGAVRDVHRTDDLAATPAIPHLRVDAASTTDDQIARVLQALGISHR